MITKATPLSAVKIILLLSSFNSFKALNSFWVMLEDVLASFCAFFRIFFTSTCNSSASSWVNLEQVCSTAAMYSPTGGFFGLMTNFGPWAKSLSWSMVKGVFDRFFTHFFISSVVISVVIHVLVFWPLFEWPIFFLCKASYLSFCLCITLLCLHSLTLFMKDPHSSKVLWTSDSVSLSWMVSLNSLYMYPSSTWAVLKYYL